MSNNKLIYKHCWWGMLTLSLLLLWAPFSVSAGESQEPEQIIQALSDQLQKVLKNERDRLKTDRTYVYRLADEVIAPHVDFYRVSSLALGKYWRRASQAQKREFVHQFQRMLVRTYATAFHEFGEWSIRFLPRHDAAGAGRVTVHTEVLRPGAQPATVDYRMHYKDGAWMAYDVIIEGISLVTNYRSSFAKEARRGGMDGLIQRITELNNRRVSRAEGA